MHRNEMRSAPLGTYISNTLIDVKNLLVNHVCWN